jgi:hypothetical protein
MAPNHAVEDLAERVRSRLSLALLFADPRDVKAPLALGRFAQRCHRIRADSKGTATPHRRGMARAV